MINSAITKSFRTINIFQEQHSSLVYEERPLPKAAVVVTTYLQVAVVAEAYHPLQTYQH